MQGRDLCQEYYKILDRECGLSVFVEKIKRVQKLLVLNLLTTHQVSEDAGYTNIKGQVVELLIGGICMYKSSKKDV